MSEETAENNPNKKRSRKKRKNFLINAKKYAKKGQMGRGTRIPEELYQYFVGILDAIKQGIEDKDEKQALVNNVLERTKGDELNIVGNQLGCRVVEMLLPYASAEDLERFMDILFPQIRPLCSDVFSSHVVEALLKIACERATAHLQTEENLAKDNIESEDDVPNKKRKSNLECEVPKKKSKLDLPEPEYTEEHTKKCYEFTLKICKYTLNNLEDFVWDQFANHILRSALRCLSGITLLPGEKPKTSLFKETLPDNKGIPPVNAKIVYRIVPDEFKELVKEFSNRLSSWPQFKDLPYKNETSGLLQVLLYAIKNVDKHATRDLIKKLLDESFAPENWVSEGGNDDEKKDEKVDLDQPQDETANDETAKGNLAPVFESEPAVRLLEAALFVAKRKTYTQLYARCFINRLGQLATMPMLNYTVQRLIDNCQIKEELEPMFDELSDKFPALLACGNTGVLVALAKACLRVQARQAHFVNKLEAALGCADAAKQCYFSVCCLRLLPVDRIDVNKLEKEYFINVHGSVILQTILDFQRPAKAVSGLLELSPEALVVILCDAKGCHVADKLCKGQCVGAKARDKLVWRLKGFYQKLALSQYGSRAFEQVFQACSPEQRVKIMTEISEKSNLLNSTQYGRLIASKLDVEVFKLSQKKWEEAWKKKNK